MSTAEKDPNEHVSDGIRELDNPPPTWFTALFGVTVVFGLAYLFYYTLGGGPTLVEEYEKEKASDDIASYSRSLEAANKLPSEGELAAMLKDSARLSVGKAAFGTRCASCHGAAGQGGIGPNLTDRHWIHGGKPLEILKTISNGVADKGMPGWGPVLSRDELIGVALYVRSIVGTQPAGAKAPQGTPETQ